jgi:hypothetical protein
MIGLSPLCTPFKIKRDQSHLRGNEAGQIDEKTEKLYYFNKYLKGQTQTLDPESKD